MTPEQEKEATRIAWEASHQGNIFAQSRSSELADEFTRLEVQIAAILFAFTSIFMSSLTSGQPSESLTQLTPIKHIFAVSQVLLLFSLALGLVHIKRKELFWDEALKQRASRLSQWEKVLRGEISFEAGKHFQSGTALGREGSILKSPTWTWALQTVFLGIALMLMLILFIIILYR